MSPEPAVILSRRRLVALLAVAFPPAVLRRRRARAAVQDLDRDTLLALAEVALPGAAGTAGRAAAVAGLLRWIDGYRGGAEVLHGYGTADIRYLPPSPAPRWTAQAAELDRQAVRRGAASFRAAPIDTRRALVTAALEGERGPAVPDPARAGHIALALIAFWADSPAGTDLAYRARIGRLGCRPIDGNPTRPPRWDGEA
ncbi:MAG: hypothetical protein R2882_04445 [Gemmatimonadales bacterium]